MRKELCLKWADDEINAVTKKAVNTLVELDLLEPSKRGKVLARPRAGSAKAYQLMMLGQAMVPMLQRFYLVIAILAQHGSGTLTRSRLERMCELSAERLSMIYGLHSPDFFNKTLFHDFIRKLQDQEVLRRNGEGLLEFDEDILGIGTDARLVLGEQIRHSILSLTVPTEQEDE
jgi:glycerol-3-phosphate O-acyltransferase